MWMSLCGMNSAGYSVRLAFVAYFDEALQVCKAVQFGTAC
jgi:hypothetical protein